MAPSAEVYRRWTAIAQRLGLACVFDASRDELAYFERALVIARASADEAAMARAGYWLGYVSYALGDAASAVRHGEAAWQMANRIQDEPLKVQIRAALGQARSAACEYAAATVLLDEAIGIKRRHLSGAKPAVGLAFTLATKATVLGDRGEFGAAHACFDEALAVVGLPIHEVGASIRGLRSVVYTWQGRWNEAHDCASEAYRIAERVRSLFSFSMTHAACAYAQWARGGDPACLQALADATSWLEPRRSGLFRSLNFGWLAHALATSGRHEEARHAAARALVRARQHDYLGVAMAYRALATSAAHARDLPRARACLARADQVAGRRGAPHESASNRWCEAGIEARLGNPSNAMRRLDEAATAFERLDMRWHLEAVNRQRGGTQVA